MNSHERGGQIDHAVRLADFVRDLPDFRMYTTLGDPYGHIGATVADAILQANRRYVAFVRPRVQRILREYPSARTTTAVRLLLSETGTTTFLGVRDTARAVRVEQVLAMFAAEAIETEADLREWLVERNGGVRLQTIRGIGPKTADYFKILVGLPASAIDMHLRAFLALAGITAASYQAAQTVVDGAADVLGVDRALFDHSIWQYMSQRAEETRRRKHRGRQRDVRCGDALIDMSVTASRISAGHGSRHR